MAVHDYVIDNDTGSAVRADINAVLQAIVSLNSSSSEPSTKYAYMLWADTTTGILKIRNSANNGWVELFQLDGTITLEDGTNSLPALAFRDDLDTGLYSSGANVVDISCGGTRRGSFSSSGLSVTGNVTATTFVGNIDAVDGDFDGTLEADAITVAGVALNTVIAGVTVTNSTNAANVVVADESSDTTCFPLFVTGATGNLPAKTGTNLAFNSANGTLTATKFAGDGSSLTGLPAANLTGTASAINGSNITNVNAATLDSIDSSQFLRSDAADSSNSLLTLSGGISLNGVVKYPNFATHSGGTITINFANVMHIVTLNQNSSMGQTGSSNVLGQSGSIFIVQDSTGGRTLSFSSHFKFAGGVAPTITTTANAIDRLDYIVKANGEVHAVITLDIK